MKQCPYCGAQLQEQAQFCLYCMRSLENKPDITPRLAHKKRWLLLTVVAAVLLAAVLIALFAFDRSEEETPARSSSCSPPSTRPTEQVPKQSICTPFGFSDAAMYSENPYWEPIFVWPVGEKEGWSAFSVPMRLNDSRLDLYFYRDGEKIYAVLGGLSESDLQQGVTVAGSLVDALCSGYDRSEAYLDEGRLFSGEAVEVESSLSRSLSLEDPLGQQTDANTEWTVTRTTTALVPRYYGYPDSWMTCELRQRTWEGKAVYDIFLFFDQP